MPWRLMPRLKSVSWRNWHSVMGLESARQEAFALVIQPPALVGIQVDKLEAQGLPRAGGGSRELPLHPVAAGLGSQGETLAIRSEGPALVPGLAGKQAADQPAACSVVGRRFGKPEQLMADSGMGAEQHGPGQAVVLAAVVVQVGMTPDPIFNPEA